MTESKIIEDWRNSLLSQKGLLRSYFSCYFLVGGKYDRYIVIASTALTGILVALLSVCVDDDHLREQIFKAIQSISAVSLNISIGLLGFLIAAFAIFMSTTSKTLLIQLSKIRRKGTNLSEFMFILLSYTSIFVDYVIILVVSSICVIVSTDKGLIAEASSGFTENSPALGLAGNIVVIALLVGLSIQALLALKSFLWNLYQSLVLYVATLPE